MEINLGCCPIVVRDEDTAKRAAEWVEKMTLIALGEQENG